MKIKTILTIALTVLSLTACAKSSDKIDWSGVWTTTDIKCKKSKKRYPKGNGCDFTLTKINDKEYTIEYFGSVLEKFKKITFKANMEKREFMPNESANFLVGPSLFRGDLYRLFPKTQTIKAGSREFYRVGDKND